ncbi:MAG: hypothetical protein A2622_13955 [Bdellovibrionales bacterium RIFCSPHIGHO2_01_FULL_40_29]|nr:MAG: hypothetical protein A2622_13955 [Bdellovibrionales bacterium RIFCSPHIGHO2_01_FULL_40_29]OFZ33625.1 MAG: hypothetical protein A3D17_11565 [Bdellovibrionales bacterium RIFCSPHIGHO2_02_FULL_40_15]
MLLNKLRIQVLIGFVFFYSSYSLAQDIEEDQEIQGVEIELEKNIPSPTSIDSVMPHNPGKKQNTLVIEGDTVQNQFQSVVIQKNYMPKTDRFGLSGGVTLFPSDVFFKTFGAQIRGSYYLNETWGAEISGILLSSTKSTELQDLESKQGVTAHNLATLKNYLGVNLYFSSMYGKYALNDRKIFPFEIYQTVGLGQVATDKSSGTAFSLGMGQVLSLSRNDALRFDLSVLFYQTETVSAGQQAATSLLVSLSYSSFFPTVGKRW